MKKKFSITVCLLISCGLACAALTSIEGKWAGDLPLGKGKNYPLSYTFYTNNGKLTGFNVSDGEKTELADGKIFGDSISFMLDAMGSKMLHTGKYFADGDSIGLNINLGGKTFHGTLKRVGNK